jgi:YfiH family protein
MHLVELTSRPLEESALLSFPAFDALPGFRHAITTKPWNMSLKTGPALDLAAQRRKVVCNHLGLPFDRLVAPNQIHSPHVVRIQESDARAGNVDPKTAIQFVDGLVCDLANTPIIQFSADCPMIAVVDAERRVFGTAHASWRGTVASITTELIRQLVREFNARPEQMTAAICPCAGPGEYEVGEDVLRIARARLNGAVAFFPKQNGRYHFDMRAANVAQLVDAGVPTERIFVATASTMTDDRFYSHRREGEKAGRFALIAGFTAA